MNNNSSVDLQLAQRLVRVIENIEQTERDFYVLQRHKLRFLEQLMRLLENNQSSGTTNTTGNSRSNSVSTPDISDFPNIPNTPPPSINLNTQASENNINMRNINDFVSNMINETMSNTPINTIIPNNSQTPSINPILVRYTTMFPFNLEHNNTPVQSTSRGLTEQQIRSSTTNTTFENAQNPLNVQECIIRHEAFELNTHVTRIHNCNHIFSTPSIMNWLRNNNTCPVCRQPVYQEQEESQTQEE